MNLDSFLKQNSSEIRKNIFYEYKNEILELKKKGATLKLILKYLIQNSDEIKNKYTGKEMNGIVYLSQTLKRWQKDMSDNTQIKEAKNEVKTTIKENENEVKDDEKKDVKKDLWADEKVDIMLQEISVSGDEDLKKLV